MSHLVIDLGNTRWKLARTCCGDLLDVAVGSYDRTDDLRAAVLEAGSGIRGVFYASVAGAESTRLIAASIEQALGLPVTQVLSTDRVPGVTSGYRKPEQLGVDRLMAMVAVRAVCRAPFCVVDAGTAVTIDFVDANGLHLGGVILPGSRVFRECLLAATAIPRDAQVDDSAQLGRDTPTAVSLGARYAVAGIVERFTTGTSALFPGESVQVFVGGGDAGRYIDVLPTACTKMDNLVLRGLAVVAASGDH